MGNRICTLEVYECERYFNNEIKMIKQFINIDEYNNFCDEFETLHYKSKLIDILTNIEKSNYCIKEKLMRINVVIRYLNCTALFSDYINKSTAQYYCKKFIDNKIPSRLQTYRYSSFKASGCYEWLMFISFCYVREQEFY